MIKIIKAEVQPIENANIWSYPIDELDYLLDTADDGSMYMLWNGRLYESGCI